MIILNLFFFFLKYPKVQNLGAFSTIFSKKKKQKQKTKKKQKKKKKNKTNLNRIACFPEGVIKW